MNAFLFPLFCSRTLSKVTTIRAREILILKEELYKIISKHSGQDYDKVYADSDRDYWMKSEKALEYGMIDEILTRG